MAKLEKLTQAKDAQLERLNMLIKMDMKVIPSSSLR
jgi:hypothetical protein